MNKPIDNWDFIKHEKFMDVAFEVEFAHDLGETVLVCGYWWNQGLERSWLIPYKDPRFKRRIQFAYPGVTSQTFHIKKSELSKWSKLKRPAKDPDCLRNCEWEKVA